MEISPNLLIEVIAGLFFGLILTNLLYSIATNLKGSTEKGFVVGEAAVSGLIIVLGVSPRGTLLRNLVELTPLPTVLLNISGVVLMVASVLGVLAYPYKLIRGENYSGLLVFMLSFTSGGMIGIGIDTNSTIIGLGISVFVISLITSLFIEGEMIPWGR